jgi:hypothetical protein
MTNTHEEVLGALVRGYCTKENEKKTMDPELCKAQADAIESLIKERYVPRTTMSGVDEFPPKDTLGIPTPERGK